MTTAGSSVSPSSTPVATASASPAATQTDSTSVANTSTASASDTPADASDDGDAEPLPTQTVAPVATPSPVRAARTAVPAAAASTAATVAQVPAVPAVSTPVVPDPTPAFAVDSCQRRLDRTRGPGRHHRRQHADWRGGSRRRHRPGVRYQCPLQHDHRCQRCQLRSGVSVALAPTPGANATQTGVTTAQSGQTSAIGVTVSNDVRNNDQAAVLVQGANRVPAPCR